MKKAIAPVLSGLILGLVGFFIGQDIGYGDGMRSSEMIQDLKSIDEIKSELKEKESDDITSLLEGKAGIKSVDEGTLLKAKYVQYFSGNLTNSAIMASAKDIKLNVNFYSKTKANLGSQEITIYELLQPGESVKFKERITIPEKVEEFDFQIVGAESDYTEVY